MTGGTLSDLRRFLVEKTFRYEFLKTVTDQEIVYYWENEFPLLTARPQASILTRLDGFLRPKLLRHMVCQKENKIDFEKIMNNKQIFLAKLAQGAIGEENAYLLGTLFVSAIHQIALSRQRIKEEERQNFYLYIDEFQNFVTPSMAAVLSGARKYHLGLILAHQEFQQLWEKDKGVAHSVISNPCTRICFRLGEFDGKKLEEGFSSFKLENLQNLAVGEAIARIEKAEYDFNLKTQPSPKVDPALAQQRKEKLIKLSQVKYGKKREEIEKELAQARSRTIKKTKTQLSKEPELTDIEQRFLSQVSDKPSHDSQKIAEDLNLSNQKVQEMIASLEERKVVDVIAAVTHQ